MVHEAPLKIGDFPLSSCETSILKYPPKTTIERDFSLENFTTDNQEMGCKLRWEALRIGKFNEEQCLLPDKAARRYEDLDEMGEQGANCISNKQ